MKRNLIIALQIVKYIPVILFRYFKYLFLGKEPIINEFRPNSNYCIEGALNQLIWNVENILFVILDNSSKVYLSSSDFIFRVTEENTNFSLKSYGYNKSITSNTNIQVVILKQKSFDENTLKNKISILKNYNPRLIHSQNINNGLQKVSSFSSIQFKPISISDKVNSKKLISFKEPIKQLTKIDNFKTIDQINNHQI